MISVHSQGKPFNIMVIQVYAPTTNAEKKMKLTAFMKTYKTFSPASEVRGSGRECQVVTAPEQPRGAIPTRGQGHRPGGATTCPRNSGCAGTGGPTGAIPRSRSGGAAVRRYPSSKVRSNSCTLLEQP